MRRGKKMVCSECGEEATVRPLDGLYRFEESGLDSVYLAGLEVVACDACGTQDPIIPRMEGVLRTIAQALLEKPTPLTGPEIKYLRQYCGVSGADFARSLGIDRANLANWESGRRTPGAANDRLVRLLALTFADVADPKRFELEELSKLVTDVFRGIRSDPKVMRVNVKTSDMSYEYVAA